MGTGLLGRVVKAIDSKSIDVSLVGSNPAVVDMCITYTFYHSDLYSKSTHAYDG